jgi:Ca-activated chloride channel family protein
VVAALVWLCLVGAVAKPEWVGAPIEKTEAARDVMLAIDISGSMDKRDFSAGGGDPVQRLAAVKGVVGRFMAARDGDRIGLIVFGSKAYVQVPFTRDLRTAVSLLEAIEVGMAGPHTVLGDAIGLAVRTFEASEVEERLLILLTDGSDTGSRMTPLNAAEIAAQNDVEIFTVGVGDPEGQGEDRVDFETLERIAERGGGRFFSADEENGLEDVYRRIDAIVPRDVKTVSYRPRESLVHWPAGAAAILAIIGYLLLLGLSRRVQPA